MNTHEGLVKGRNRLAQRWGKGSLSTYHGGVCFLGSVNWAVYDDAERSGSEYTKLGRGMYYQLWKAARQLAKENKSGFKFFSTSISDLNCRVQRFMHFNDRGPTRKNHVLAIYDRAIHNTAPKPEINFLPEFDMDSFNQETEAVQEKESVKIEA